VVSQAERAVQARGSFAKLLFVRSLFAKLRARRARRASLGTAVFIVVVTTMGVTGLGIYAISRTTQLTRATGFTRQMMQTHYVADMGLLGGVANLRKTGGAGYIDVMTLPEDRKQAADRSCSGYKANMSQTCMLMSYDDVASGLDQANPPDLLVPAKPKQPGSLGPANLEGDFRLELTDLHSVVAPVRGEDLSDPNKSLKHFFITLSVRGEVRPESKGDAISASAMSAAGIERARAHVIVGPLLR